MKCAQKGSEILLDTERNTERRMCREGDARKGDLDCTDQWGGGGGGMQHRHSSQERVGRTWLRQTQTQTCSRKGLYIRERDCGNHIKEQCIDSAKVKRRKLPKEGRKSALGTAMIRRVRRGKHLVLRRVESEGQRQAR